MRADRAGSARQTVALATSSVLELREVKRHFGGIRAVDGVTLRISEGSVVALIGPNGAGKSTLFALMMGELGLSDGEILLDGSDMRGLTPERRSRAGIGRTFQTPRLFAGLSVRENVEIALLASRAEPRGGLRTGRRGSVRSHPHVQAALEEAGLGEQGGLLASSLSQGQRKRLELAMVLALRPRVLLLDEPTAGMGVDERARIMKTVMAAVRRRGLTMVFCEHDMETVFAHAERVIVMDHGALLADGAPAAVKSDLRVQQIYLGAQVGRDA
jgi:branched-chain amino acid transport system ATP-binding protein